MDSKIIFIDSEGPSIEEKEGEGRGGECECVSVCVEVGMCVTGPIQYPETQAFCPCPHINSTPCPTAFHLH